MEPCFWLLLNHIKHDQYHNVQVPVRLFLKTTFVGWEVETMTRSFFTRDRRREPNRCRVVDIMVVDMVYLRKTIKYLHSQGIVA